MSRARSAVVVLASIGAACLWAGPAGAEGPVGQDPSSNFAVGPTPGVCDSAPTGPACIAASVQYLDEARASLGQPPYQVPVTFAGLTPEEQALVLTNLDRIQYGLPPMPGLTTALNQAAVAGVKGNADPSTNDPAIDSYTSNWAGGFANLPLAYEAWMYDDGPGSGNVDCTPTSHSGCWGHRHDILWDFGPGGPLAMGAGTGTDHQGSPGYTVLLVRGSHAYHPAYAYTWSQALGAGAGGSQLPSVPVGGTPSHVTLTLISLRVHGHLVAYRVRTSPGLRLQCSLIQRAGSGWSRDRFRACKSSQTFARVRSGRYRLRIRATGAATITRYVRVR